MIETDMKEIKLDADMVWSVLGDMAFAGIDVVPLTILKNWRKQLEPFAKMLKDKPIFMHLETTIKRKEGGVSSPSK